MDRITPEHIEQTIRSETYHRFPGTTLTVCCLVLRNGFTAVGQSACVDPAMFDAEIGKKLAYDDAKSKVWQLEGYLLAERLDDARRKSDAIRRSEG